MCPREVQVWIFRLNISWVLKAAKRTFKMTRFRPNHPRAEASRSPRALGLRPCGVRERRVPGSRKSGLRPARVQVSRAGTCFLPKPVGRGPSPRSPASRRPRWCPATPLAAGPNFPLRKTKPRGPAGGGRARPQLVARALLWQRAAAQRLTLNCVQNFPFPHRSRSPSSITCRPFHSHLGFSYSVALLQLYGLPRKCI